MAEIDKDREPSLLAYGIVALAAVFIGVAAGLWILKLLHVGI